MIDVIFDFLPLDIPPFQESYYGVRIDMIITIDDNYIKIGKTMIHKVGGSFLTFMRIHILSMFVLYEARTLLISRRIRVGH